jgi:nicotinamidase-related amidase
MSSSWSALEDSGLERVSEPGRLRTMIDPRQTALVVIDVQVDFAAPDGAMAAFGADLSAVGPAIERMLEAINAARQAGMPLVWLRVMTREDTDSGAAQRLRARRGLGPEALAVCREGTRGSDYHLLRPQEDELEIDKRLYSGFQGTSLDQELRSRGIGAVVLMGLTTECCVDSTARDAFQRGYDVFVVADACAAYHKSQHLSSLEILSQSFALLTSSATLVAALTPGIG